MLGGCGDDSTKSHYELLLIIIIISPDVEHINFYRVIVYKNMASKQAYPNVERATKRNRNMAIGSYTGEDYDVVVSKNHVTAEDFIEYFKREYGKDVILVYFGYVLHGRLMGNPAFINHTEYIPPFGLKIVELNVPGSFQGIKGVAEDNPNYMADIVEEIKRSNLSIMLDKSREPEPQAQEQAQEQPQEQVPEQTQEQVQEQPQRPDESAVTGGRSLTVLDRTDDKQLKMITRVLVGEIMFFVSLYAAHGIRCHSRSPTIELRFDMNDVFDRKQMVSDASWMPTGRMKWFTKFKVDGIMRSMRDLIEKINSDGGDDDTRVLGNIIGIVMKHMETRDRKESHFVIRANQDHQRDLAALDSYIEYYLRSLRFSTVSVERFKSAMAEIACEDGVQVEGANFKLLRMDKINKMQYHGRDVDTSKNIVQLMQRYSLMCITPDAVHTDYIYYGEDGDWELEYNTASAIKRRGSEFRYLLCYGHEGFPTIAVLMTRGFRGMRHISANVAMSYMNYVADTGIRGLGDDMINAVKTFKEERGLGKIVVYPIDNNPHWKAKLRQHGDVFDVRG